tara:strand:+ start:227 stop:499 length:273 start_codon:yes stop_codon:yes gene_type:complete
LLSATFITKEPARMYDNSEEFMTEITALVAKYGDYEAPILKSDGDLLIPLRADLKRSAAAADALAKAMADMMRKDKSLQKAKAERSGWIV